jgi:hypothetical protein
MKILLVRLRLIGDVVFTTPLIRAVRHAYPDARIAYLVEPDAAPVVQHNPHLDEVIVAPRRRGARRIADDLALAGRLRGERFDLVLDLHGGPRSAWLTWASGARERIGYDIKGRRWMYTRIVRLTRSCGPPLESTVGICRGDPGWTGGPRTRRATGVEMALDADAGRAASGAARTRRRHKRHELVVLHVGAGIGLGVARDVFQRRRPRLAAGQPRRRLVFSSGPSDREAASRMTEDARQRLGAGADRIIDLGEFDLQELRALIGTEPAVRRRRHRTAAHRRGHGHAGRRHLRTDAGAPRRRGGPPRSRRFPSSSRISCRPCDQRVCAPGDFRCLTQLMPAAVIAAAERALLPLAGASHARVR